MIGDNEEYPEIYENDLEEHEKNELAKDRELEEAEPQECEVCGRVDCPGCCDCGDCDYCEAQAHAQFADPGGRSALRASSPSNPRNLPCPNCGGENLLTPEDRARGYQCDACADAAEGWGP